MQTASHHGVLVVGAGPVGLALAVDLARRDVPLRIIDRSPAPTDESRAIVIHARTLDQLEPLGVCEPLIGAGLVTQRVTFHADGKELARVPFDRVDSRYPFSLTTAQTETERVLTARLRELGVEIERGVTLVGFEQTEREVRASVRLADKRADHILCDWLVGADGSHSSVRGAMGQQLVGSFKGEDLLLGDVEADFDYDPASFHLFFSPGETTALLFPMVGARARVFAQIPEGVDRDREPSLAWLREALAERQVDVRIRDARWLARFEIHHAQVARYRSGRAFLAGDAAHIHSPAGGQGMNTGIQDALNLSWKLALAARGKASEALLESYHDERFPVAAHVISFTNALTKLGTLDSWLLRKLRNHAMRAALKLAGPQHALANQVEEQNVRYRTSPVVHEGGMFAVRAGDYLRDDDRRSVCTALRAEVAARRVSHVALLVPGPDLDLPSIELPDTVNVVGTEPLGRELAARTGLSRTGGFVLLRPDGYIGLVALGEQVNAARRYFERIGVV